MTAPAGPLAGLKVLEMGSIGPAPYAAMVLADMGAEVIRVDRPSAVPPPGSDQQARNGEVTLRGRRNIAVDLKHPDGRETLLELVAAADVLIEGFRPGAHHFDGGAHFFEVYETADGRFISVAAIESQFYRELLERLGLADDPDFAVQSDKSRWPELKQRFVKLFLTRTQAQWRELLEGTDACFAPLLRLSEVAADPHTIARGTVVEVGGIRQAAPAPRFSRTVPRLGRPPAPFGQDTVEVLSDWGIPADRVQRLLDDGAVATVREH